MKNNFEIIQDLLRSKAEYQARLNLIPYNGSVEIKEVSEKKYLYINYLIIMMMNIHQSLILLKCIIH